MKTLRSHLKPPESKTGLETIFPYNMDREEVDRFTESSKGQMSSLPVFESRDWGHWATILGSWSGGLASLVLFLPASTGDGARDYLSSRLWQIWASCLYEQALYSFRIWSIFSIKSQDEKKSHWSFWVSIKCCWNLSSKFSPYQWQWLKIRCAVHPPPPQHTHRGRPLFPLLFAE